MSQKSSQLYKYLAIGGFLGATYFLFNYLSNNKPVIKSKVISLEITQKIIRQIKYQMYTFVIPFSQAIKNELQLKNPPKDIQIYLRTQLSKGYQIKQDLILDKYNVNKDQYSLALKKYQYDPDIKQTQEEIFKVLEDTIKGNIDLTIPYQAKQLFTEEQVLKLYRQLLEEICLQVADKMQKSIKQHPGFDPKDNQHYKEAMKQLNIYQFKVGYLLNRGFKKQWGCPNLVFLKLLQTIKRDNKNLKIVASSIDRAYAKIIGQVSSNPEAYNRTIILRVMEDELNKASALQKPSVVPVAIGKSQSVSMPQPPKMIPNRSVQVGPSKPKKEDQFDLQKLMMQQLLSRSQQAQRQEKIEVIQPLPPKVEQVRIEKLPVVEQTKVEPIVQQKQEQVQAKQESVEERIESKVVVSDQRSQAPRSQSLLQAYKSEQQKRQPQIAEIQKIDSPRHHRQIIEQIESQQIRTSLIEVPPIEDSEQNESSQ